MLLHFSPAVSSLFISKCINYHVHITAGKLPHAGAPHSQELGLEPGRQKKTHTNEHYKTNQNSSERSKTVKA